MLLLFYSLLNVLLTSYALIPKSYLAFARLQTGSSETFRRDILTLGVESFVFGLSFVLLKFAKFHISLVLRNSTTIEQLDKRLAGNFDLGYQDNWRQVFGSNPWLWPLPWYGKSGKPAGDGVNWLVEPIVMSPPKNATSLLESVGNRPSYLAESEGTLLNRTPAYLRSADVSMTKLN
jgi:hypothetical protein